MGRKVGVHAVLFLAEELAIALEEEEEVVLEVVLANMELLLEAEFVAIVFAVAAVCCMFE